MTNSQRRCITKTRYLSRSIARKAAKQISKRMRVPFFVYRCPECEEFHLTKKAQNVEQYRKVQQVKI